MPRPLIGICAAIEQAQWSVWDQPAMLLPRNYLDACHRAGAMTVMLGADPGWVEDPLEALGLLDGLMLAGGADIDPSFYGARAHPQTTGTVPERDRFEIALVRAAIEQDLPVLGICRGMQLINVALGGTLHQHLPELYGHGEHRRVLGSFDGAEHEVRLLADTLAWRVVGGGSQIAKSHHHQGIDRLGDGLCASGLSALDPLIEAIELPGRRFVLGVQWHPEADVDSPVIAGLIDAARGAVGTFA